MADTLNGYDLKQVFGTIVNNGKAALFGWAKRKSSLEQDLQEENGILIDLDDPKYEAREITFHCSTVGPDEEFGVRGAGGSMSKP